MSREKNNAATAVVEKEYVIDAALNEAFPYISPVHEYFWIPGWKCRFVHFPNGFIEKGSVFEEYSSSVVFGSGILARSRFTVTEFDPVLHNVYFRIETKVSASVYKVEYREHSPGKTAVRLELSYTPLNRKGERIAARYGDSRIAFMLEYLSACISFFWEHGRKMDGEEVLAFLRKSTLISSGDKLRLALNRFLRLFIPDRNRKKVLKGLPIIKIGRIADAAKWGSTV